MDKVSRNAYFKVIASGNVLEVYEAQKEPYAPDKPLNPNDDYDPFDFENTKLERGDRKDERRGQTTRDARNTTRRLALMNFKSGDKFLTLTFDPKRFTEYQLREDILFLDNELKKFIKRFNYRFQCNLKYIAVREFHKSGRIHFHMICDWSKHFTCEEEIREFERLLGEKVWKNGWVDIKQMDHVDNVGAYLIKYMTKNVAVNFFKGRKIYLCSKGLQRPVVYRGLEAELIINTYNLKNKKEVYTNSYESEYLGQITYKEYNLKRL